MRVGHHHYSQKLYLVLHNSLQTLKLLDIRLQENIRSKALFQSDLSSFLALEPEGGL